MKAWRLLDRAPVPAGPTELRLYQRDDEFSIRVDGLELMNSRAAASEVALAELGCAHVRSQPAPRVLIGGLGMGFSLRAALSQLPAAAVVEVAELVPAVVRWSETYLGQLAEHPLRDARVRVVEQDVAQPIRAASALYDAILLDIDNGPNALTHPGNDWIYARAGLLAVQRALRPKGVFGVWSSTPVPAFVLRMRRVGFAVEERSVRARARGRGARHTVWLATRGRLGS